MLILIKAITFGLTRVKIVVGDAIDSLSLCGISLVCVSGEIVIHLNLNSNRLATTLNSVKH